MPRIFDVDHLLDVPTAERYAELLTARADLDLATADAARSEMFEAVRRAGAAVLIDVTGVFVGVVLVRCLVELAERATGAGKPVVLIRAPGWLVDLQPRLDMPPLRSVDTLDAAVAELRAATGAATDGAVRRVPVTAAAC
jgi:hypothetical protein